MTLKDIAKAAGVSSMTVSNVINKRFDKVSKETVEHVNKIIHELHYVPNMSAHTLATKSSKMVLLIIPSFDVEVKNSYYGSYISSLVGIMETILCEQGYYTMLRSTNDPEEMVEMFSRWVLDGAIVILPDFDARIETTLSSESIPIVYIDSGHDSNDGMHVNCDDFQGGYVSTKHLLVKGHKQIAFAGDYDNNPIHVKRFNGYLKALSENKITPSKSLLFSILQNYENGLKTGTEIAIHHNDISAIVTCSDLFAIGVIEALYKNNVDVPGKVSVIGFENLPICNYTTPKLTSVCEDWTEKGKNAVALLLNNISGKDTIHKNYNVPVSIVERESVKGLSHKFT